MKYDRKIFTSLFDIEKNDIIAKQPVKIIINKDEHPELTDTGDSYELIGTFKVCDVDETICTIAPFIFTVQIPKTGDITTDGNLVIIQFEPGEVAVHGEYKVLESDIQAIRAILENRVQFFKYDIGQQLTVLEELFSNIVGTVPLVFFEIILSELYRCPDDLSKPARYCVKNYKEAEPVDIKKAIHLSSDLKRAISYGYTKEALAQSLAAGSKSQKEDILIKTTTE